MRPGQVGRSQQELTDCLAHPGNTGRAPFPDRVFRRCPGWCCMCSSFSKHDTAAACCPYHMLLVGGFRKPAHAAATHASMLWNLGLFQTHPLHYLLTKHTCSSSQACCKQAINLHSGSSHSRPLAGPDGTHNHTCTEESCIMAGCMFDSCTMLKVSCRLGKQHRSQREGQ